MQIGETSGRCWERRKRGGGFEGKTEMMMRTGKGGEVYGSVRLRLL